MTGTAAPFLEHPGSWEPSNSPFHTCWAPNLSIDPARVPSVPGAEPGGEPGQDPGVSAQQLCRAVSLPPTCTGGQAGLGTRLPEVTRGQGPGHPQVTCGQGPVASIWDLAPRHPLRVPATHGETPRSRGRSDATYVLEASHKALLLWTCGEERQQRREEEIWSGCETRRTPGSVPHVTTQPAALGTATLSQILTERLLCQALL